MKRFARQSRLIAFLAPMTLSAIGCSDPVQPVPSRTLTGNWGSNSYSSAAFSLTEKDGVITGHGWITQLSTAVAVTGMRDGKDVLLTLAFPTLPIFSRTFRGEFS